MQNVLTPVAKPRVRSVPDYRYTSGDDAIDLAEAAGLVLDEWQREVVRDIMAEKSDGTWLAPSVVLVAPRQNSKSTMLITVMLADLFLMEANRLVVFSAHEIRSANEIFTQMVRIIEAPGNEWMRHKIKPNGIRTANGQVSLVGKNGTRIMFTARSKGAGRGMSIDRLLYDEAYNLPAETLAAMLPAMSARPNAQVVYASSAPVEHPDSDVLRALIRRGRRTPVKGSKELAPAPEDMIYIEFSSPPDADIDDESTWVIANPAVSTGRISLETIRAERAAMPEHIWVRERLGIINEASNGGVIDIDLWDSLADAASSPLDPVVFSVDVSPDQSTATIAMAGMRADGLMHVEIVKRDRGTAWVPEALATLQTNWNPALIVLDPIGQNNALVPLLDEQGVIYSLLSTRDVVSASAFLYAQIQEKRLRHFPTPPLRTAVEAATKRNVGESGWAFSRKGTTDITPLVAITLAAYAQARANGMTEPEPEKAKVHFFR